MTEVLWAVVVAAVFIAGLVYQARARSKHNRQLILNKVLKEEGPEAAKAMEARLKGEWR
jgi:cytochrome c-type biogenesis protein CcmH/NrfF